MLSYAYRVFPDHARGGSRMQSSRLSLKSLWRLYYEAQEMLASGQINDAVQSFHRIATARLRRRRRPGGEGADTHPRVFVDSTSGPAPENPLAVWARLGLCDCFV